MSSGIKNILNKKNRKNGKLNIKLRYKNPLYLTMFIVIFIGISVVFTYASLSNLEKKIVSQRKEIEELKKTKMTLIGDIKGIKSSTQIQEEAIYRLGMVYPREDQIVYVEIGEDKKEIDVNNNVFLSPIISVLKSFTKE